MPTSSNACTTTGNTQQFVMPTTLPQNGRTTWQMRPSITQGQFRCLTDPGDSSQQFGAVAEFPACPTDLLINVNTGNISDTTDTTGGILESVFSQLEGAGSSRELFSWLIFGSVSIILALVGYQAHRSLIFMLVIHNGFTFMAVNILALPFYLFVLTIISSIVIFVAQQRITQG